MTRTQLTRVPELGSTDRAALYRLLDDAIVGNFALVSDDAPVVIPTAIARDGDTVLAHGSTGAGWMRRLADGRQVCLSVTEYEGLVVARSAFESSMIYRSAVIFGRCHNVTDIDEKRAALDVLTDRFLPGRVAEVRPATAKELAATLVLRLPLDEWSLKVSTDFSEDPPEDVAGDSWAGKLPLRVAYGDPIDAPDLRPGIDLPASVRALTD